MVCPKCGKVYNNRLKFCISCGAELVEGEDNQATDTAITMSGGVFGNIAEFPTEAEQSGFVREIDHVKKKDTDTAELPLSEQETVPVTVKSAEKSAAGGKRFARNTAVVLMSAVLFAAMTLLLCTYAGRLLTSESTINDAVRNIDLLNIPVSELGVIQTEGYNIPSGATVEEAITVMTAGSGITSGNIRRICENSTFRSFLSGIVTEYAEYLRNGTQPDKLTAERIKNLLSENLSVINRNTGYPLIDSDIELAYAEIERSSAAFESLSVNGIESTPAGKYIRLVRALISVPAMIAEAAAVAAAILIIAVTAKKLPKTLKAVGVPCIAAGAAVLILTFLTSMQIGPFSALTGLEREVLKAVTASTELNFYQIGGVLVFAGTAASVWAASLQRTE